MCVWSKVLVWRVHSNVFLVCPKSPDRVFFMWKIQCGKWWYWPEWTAQGDWKHVWRFLTCLLRLHTQETLRNDFLACPTMSPIVIIKGSPSHKKDTIWHTKTTLLHVADIPPIIIFGTDSSRAPHSVTICFRNVTQGRRVLNECAAEMNAEILARCFTTRKLVARCNSGDTIVAKRSKHHRLSRF